MSNLTTPPATTSTETIHIGTSQHQPATGLLARGTRDDLPLIVCLHGGGFDASYFDAPGTSFLGRTSAAGFSTLSLHRPGSPVTPESAGDVPSFRRSAEILAEQIEHAWNELGQGRPGVVLVGHSVGGAIATHLAATGADWPLLGLAISGVGTQIAASTAGPYSEIPAGIALELPFEALRPVLYGPDWTLTPETLAAASLVTRKAASTELHEIIGPWATDLAEIGPRVRAPLHYVLAEFDTQWTVSEESVREFTGHFTSAPFVDSGIWRSAGHNLEHHALGEAYVDAVTSFARRCVLEAARVD